MNNHLFSFWKVIVQVVKKKRVREREREQGRGKERRRERLCKGGVG